MSEREDSFVYNINKDYRIVGIKGNTCTLLFKNSKNQLIASLEGCQNIFTGLVLSDGRQALNDIEKKYLLSFIKTKRHKMSKEVAAFLDVSVIRYSDGKEDYLSEPQLKRRIAGGIDFAQVFIGSLNASTLRIPADSKDTSYHFGSASINKLIIEENCSVNIDLRDNTKIESVVIGEKFAGSVNLSRTSVESVFIDNNSRCNLTIADAKRCLNLQIADIYSGNLNISNSCLYALNLGYYSYADIVLTNNIIKKEITVGDSFRGGIYATNQSVDVIKIGDDCKGWIKLVNQVKHLGTKKISVGDDFAGSLNLNGDESIASINFGRKNCGKTEASYTTNLQNIKVGKFYCGTIEVQHSSIKNINIAYGASGKINVEDCRELLFIQSTIDNNLVIEGQSSSYSINVVDGDIYYNFSNDLNIDNLLPFYKKIYHNTRKILSSRFM